VSLIGLHEPVPSVSRKLDVASAKIVRWSPDAKTVAVASGESILVLRTDSARVRRLRGHEQEVDDLDFTPDSRTLVSGSRDGTLRVWDLFPEGERVTCEGITALSDTEDGIAQAVVWSPAAGSIELCDVQTGARTALLPSTIAPLSATFSTDGKRLAFAFPSELVAVDRGSTPPRVTRIARNTPQGSGLIFAPDGAILIDEGTSIDRWDEHGFSEALRADSERYAPMVSVSPDGRWAFVSIGREGQLMVDALTKDDENRMFDGMFSSFAPFTYHAGSTTVAIGGTDSKIHLYRADGGEPLRAELSGHVGLPAPIEFSKDGTRLLSIGADNTLRLWDMSTGKPRVIATRAHAQTAAMSPDWRRVLTVQGDELTLWDVATGEGRPLIAGTATPRMPLRCGWASKTSVACVDASARLRVFADDLPEDPTALFAWIHDATH
jgi:WD40 repeat protein